jgi:hypothetical protein
MILITVMFDQRIERRELEEGKKTIMALYGICRACTLPVSAHNPLPLFSQRPAP